MPKKKNSPGPKEHYANPSKKKGNPSKGKSNSQGKGSGFGKNRVKLSKVNRGEAWGQDKEGTVWQYKVGMREGVTVDGKTKTVNNRTNKTSQRIKYARYKKPGAKSWSSWLPVKRKR